MRGRVRGDRGQAVPLVLVMMLVAGAGVVVLARLGGVADDAARARTAADAAALAGALDGRAAAVALAAANGAFLEEFERHGATVEVVVHLDGVRATAYATRSVRWAP